MTKDNNRKPYVKTGKGGYGNVMRTIPYKAIDDLNPQPHSEFLKPYGGGPQGHSSFRGMEHYHPYNYKIPYRNPPVNENPAGDIIVDPCAGHRNLMGFVNGKFEPIVDVECGTTATITVNDAVLPLRDPVYGGQANVFAGGKDGSIIYQAPECGCDCEEDLDVIVIQDACGFSTTVQIKMNCRDVLPEEVVWDLVSSETTSVDCGDPNWLSLWGTLVVEEIVDNVLTIYEGNFILTNDPSCGSYSDPPVCVTTYPTLGNCSHISPSAEVVWISSKKDTYETECKAEIEDYCVIIDCGQLLCGTTGTWGCV